MEREDHGRRAVAALDAGGVHEGALHDGELPVAGEVLYGEDFGALGLGGEEEAGVDGRVDRG